MVKVLDIRPTTASASQVKSQSFVRQVKPSQTLVDANTIDSTTPRALGAGMPIGLLLALTYPTYQEIT